MTILHTYAYESGRGIGTILMQNAVSWAKERHYTIVPVCSFAQKYLKRDERKH
jgi:predicted GNAT family acetyltransferase